jgi:hypothetical protein
VKELAKSTNPVFISWLRAMLADEGIESFVFDEQISIMEGSIGIFPRRIMVPDDDLAKATRLLDEAEEHQPDD